jgi:flagellar hook-associated protein 1 FlgK
MNDCLDKRDQYIKELSSKIDIISFEDQYGRTSIMTSGGKALVDGELTWELGISNDEETGFSNVGWKNASGNLADITDSLKSGSLNGLIQMRDKHINDFLSDIDKLAEVIITQVNNIHEDGYNLNHTSAAPDNPDGISFFKELTGNYARDIDLSNKVKEDSRNIAASSEYNSTTGNPMGNDIALDVANLIEKNLFNDGTSSVINFTASITNNIGQLTKGAKDLAQYSEETMQVMEEQRANISGVSIDEEMANLIKYQYAYQAASKLYNVAEELFDSLLAAIR